MIRILLAISLLSFGVSTKAWSQDETQKPAFDEAQEAEIALKAKKRLYPGGRDEEDLKVQAQLINPIRKLAPQAEIKEEPSVEE